METYTSNPQLTISQYDPDSPRGLVLRMWTGLASALAPLGNEAVAAVIGSDRFRNGLLLLDTLATTDPVDVAAFRQEVRAFYEDLLAIGQATQEESTDGDDPPVSGPTP